MATTEIKIITLKQLGLYDGLVKNMLMMQMLSLSNQLKSKEEH